MARDQTTRNDRIGPAGGLSGGHSGVPGRDELLFLPLGGSGEIGMNLNLYGHAGRWLMVDLGVTFNRDDGPPGIELIMPDPTFIAERSDKLVGLILTHAHEDHIGAVPYLWPRLRCPVYATPFTAAVLRKKLAQANLLGQVPLTEIPLSGKLSLPPFEIELITITHSIPEPNCVVVRTPLGAVLHTGDWKIDPTPLLGDVTDEDALRRLGEEGVLACICDSTNALVDGHSGSEASVREALMRVVAGRRGKVAVTCFASNVARVETLFRVAQAHDRHVVLVGRSLHRMVEAARETGYLADVPPFVTEDESGYLPRENQLLVCTGSQGEPRAALARIAAGDHRNVSLEQGDTVIFSSRMIPGNEASILKVQNGLLRRGVKIVTDRDAPVHVSGHPARDELVAMYQWIRPRIAIPVHGERMHMTAHAELARECQVPETVVIENGSMVRLAPGPATVVDHVQAGRLALDGHRLIPQGGTHWRERNKVAHNGSAVATLVLDRKGRLSTSPLLSVHGVLDPEGDAELRAAAVQAIAEAVEALPSDVRLRDDEVVREAARVAVRRAIHAQSGKKPMTAVHLCRV